MMRSSRGFWIALGVVCLTHAFADARTGASLTAKDRELFAWFDQLGIEEFTSARMVRVQMGSVLYVGNDKVRQPDEPRAFLLWERGSEFRVLLGDLTAVTLQREGTNSRKDDYVGWREVSPEAEAAGLLRVLAKKEVDGFRDDQHDSYSDRLDLRAQAFVLARYCAARGKDELAVRLIRLAARKLEAKTPSEFAEELQGEFASLLKWRAAIAFADSRNDRRALAALFRIIAERCPASFQVERSAALANTLEAMAAEDEAYRPLTPQEFERLLPEVKARELVFQLRDENLAGQRRCRKAESPRAGSRASFA